MAEQELICKMKSYIQPFERQLALMEIESVAGKRPIPVHSLLGEPLVYQVTTPYPIERLVGALTYWETIGSTMETTGRYTHQIRRESTVNVVRNGISPAQLRTQLPFNGRAIPIPSRRVLRYGPHGVHEYRGKFFPQLAHALLNIGGADRGDMVLDPMCGSGTTLIEASLLGCTSVGVDLNPLSVLMSRAKCNILRTPPDVLVAEYESLRTDILKPHQDGDNLKWFGQLRERDRLYLLTWFSQKVLSDLDPIAVRVHTTDDPSCRDLFRLCLSNVLRRVSWQKEDDLRVRKEVHPDACVDVVTEFLNELRRTICTVLAFLYEEPTLELGPAQVVEGDARVLLTLSDLLSQLRGEVKAVVTSPPYATALPYLDTDRLSLCYLGLLPRSEHRVRDYKMIGNREITESGRRSYWLEYQHHKQDLPRDIISLIDRVHLLNQSGEVGFRRRNLSSLLAHYFLDMRQVFLGIAELLRRGGVAYVVIGNNHTIAGGQHVDIETDRLLGLLGQSAGLVLDQTIPMEMLVSRDIFKKNAVASETVLCFHK
jgi:SAM-dependent methyltransferase